MFVDTFYSLNVAVSPVLINKAKVSLQGNVVFIIDKNICLDEK